RPSLRPELRRHPGAEVELWLRLVVGPDRRDDAPPVRLVQVEEVDLRPGWSGKARPALRVAKRRPCRRLLPNRVATLPSCPSTSARSARSARSTPTAARACSIRRP